MDTVMIGIRVVCPRCADESLWKLPAAKVAEALIEGRCLMLYAGCHDTWWVASRAELDAIREYMGRGEFITGQADGRIIPAPAA